MVVEEGGGWTVEVGAQGVEVDVGVGAGSRSSSGRWGGRSRCRGVAHVYEEGLEGEREWCRRPRLPARLCFPLESRRKVSSSGEVPIRITVFARVAYVRPTGRVNGNGKGTGQQEQERSPRTRQQQRQDDDDDDGDGDNNESGPPARSTAQRETTRDRARVRRDRGSRLCKSSTTVCT